MEGIALGFVLKRRNRRSEVLVGLALLVLGLSSIVAGGALLRDSYIVSTQAASSMEPTYRLGERIIAERIDGAEAEPGDVILFAERHWFPGGELGMKRVIGVGGDRVTCCTGGHVHTDGEKVVEPYVKNGDPVGVSPGAPGYEYDVTVPDGRLFLLGDNRANSMDSRFRASGGASGTVAVDAVRARVLDGVEGRLLILLAAVVGGVVLALLGAVLALVARRRRRPRPLGWW